MLRRSPRFATTLCSVCARPTDPKTHKAHTGSENEARLAAWKQCLDAGDTAWLRAFLQVAVQPGIVNVNAPFAGTGALPLVVTAAHGYTEAVALLLGAGADPAKKDSLGMTALFAAAMQGHADVVSALIDAGASAKTKDPAGRTPLYAASLFGRLEVVRTLLACPEAARTINRRAEKKTPLFAATLMGHNDVVGLLAAAGADLEQTHTSKKETALMAAVRKKKTRTVRVLIDAGANVDTSLRDGSSAVWIACRSGARHVLRALLDAGADASKPSNNGMTPLDACVVQNFRPMVLMLLNHKELRTHATTQTTGIANVFNFTGLVILLDSRPSPG